MKNILILICVPLLIGFGSCHRTNASAAQSDTEVKPTQTTKPQAKPKPAPKAEDSYKAHNPGWLVRMDEAYQQSKKSGKPILANFTGSDWCGWCKRLTMTVFSKPEFTKWADKNVVLLEVDFPRRFRLPADIQQQNRSMQQAFGIRGYPTIWLFNATKDQSTGQYNFTPLGRTGYAGTVAQFTNALEGYLKKQ